MYDSNDLATGVLLGQNSNNGYNNGFGAYGAEWLWIIVLFALFGWGGNGFGGFGGNGARYATQGDVQRGFDTSTIVSKLDGISNGLCDGFYAVNTSLLNGFNGTERAICDLGYNLQSCLNKTVGSMA